MIGSGAFALPGSRTAHAVRQGHAFVHRGARSQQVQEAVGFRRKLCAEVVPRGRFDQGMPGRGEGITGRRNLLSYALGLGVDEHRV